jgi:REP element-mobilizing transposase RayT
MKYNPDTHHRRSIRLKHYDYSQPGAYFVTICTHDRECLFGEIVDNEMILNDYGKIVCEEWFLSTKIRNEIELYENEFVVMPNHIHGIVWVNSNDNDFVNNVGATGRSPLQNQNYSPLQNGHLANYGKPHGTKNKSLSSFIAGYKSSVTKRINQIRQTPGMPVWQRNYYERIIRDEIELDKIREYILNNPLNWETDENYKS